MIEFRGAAKPLRADDWRIVAGYLGVEIAHIRALCAVEAKEVGFEDGRPIILFERHVFYRALKKVAPGKLRLGVAAGLAIPKWVRNYPASQGARYAQLERACEIDETAGLMAISAGLGQVLGNGAVSLGWPTVQAWWAEMCQSEGAQLYAVARYIVVNRIQAPLRAGNFTAVSRIYNGAGFRKTGHHIAMARAYARRPASERVVPPPATLAEIKALRVGHTLSLTHTITEGTPSDVPPIDLPPPAPKPASPWRALVEFLTDILERLK